MFEARKITPQQYPMLCGWWTDWKFTPPPQSALPANGTSGLMVYYDNRPICAGFIYFTNSDLAWQEYIVSDRHFTDRPIRKQAMKILFAQLAKYAKDGGAVALFSSVKHQYLVNTHLEQGWQKGTENTTEMIKII